MSTLWSCITGPRLFRMLRTETVPGRNYEANFLESAAGKVITTLRFCWSFSYWTSPFLLGVLYRRGHFTADGIQSLSKFLSYVAFIYMAAIITRGVGRFMSPDYLMFTSVLMTAQREFTETNRRLLARYDFEFRAWPVNWRWDQVNIGEVKKVKIQAGSPSRRFSSVYSIPTDILAYIAAHTFGRRMMYPGATALISSLTEPVLNQGRAKLIEEKAGLRAKILTEDHNEIDTMLLDRRHTAGPNGKTLVLCSEGNAGFYEIGAMMTPMDLGFSVLGWNHPGFAGSSGAPYPSQTQNAVDAVMQYAIHELGFTPDNIVVYAWSIGGYPASWLAMNYPDIKYVILDATFDDVLPLALNQMPEFAAGLVNTTIRTYLNLNIAEQLTKYPGPVLLIRRSMDEMITTNRDPSAVHTNRGNFLLHKLLQTRYPNLVEESTSLVLQEWLSKTSQDRASLLSTYEVDDAICETMFRSYLEENEIGFPMNIGQGFTRQQKTQLLLFLASKHLEEYESTHCTPLPGRYFHEPWSLYW